MTAAAAASNDRISGDPTSGRVFAHDGVERKIESWGRRLHDAVFGLPENAALLRRLLDAPEPRALTIATDKANLLRLPWELIADDAGSLAQRIAVRRQLKTPEALVSREVQLPLRMLYIVSRPDDAGFIDPRLTNRALVTALDPLGGHVRLDFCRPPTLARTEELLREAQAAGDPYDIVHFDGHGTFLPEAQIGALCFEQSDDGSGPSKTDLVPADRLGDLLAQYKVPLVVLEACRSATIGKAAVFRSVAPRLIRAGVDSVLSMGHAVHVEAARVLLDRFYRELARGATVGHAVAQGRAASSASSGRSWTPGASSACSVTTASARRFTSGRWWNSDGASISRRRAPAVSGECAATRSSAADCSRLRCSLTTIAVSCRSLGVGLDDGEQDR